MESNPEGSGCCVASTLKSGHYLYPEKAIKNSEIFSVQVLTWLYAVCIRDTQSVADAANAIGTSIFLIPSARHNCGDTRAGLRRDTGKTMRRLRYFHLMPTLLCVYAWVLLIAAPTRCYLEVFSFTVFERVYE
jgi:hypothetical protein